MILGAVLMVMDRDAVAALPVVSVTLKVARVGPPTVVGVPEIMPLELSVSPAGNALEANVQVYEGVPPVAARVCA